jgi:aspartyl-tRNA(Asn)/glutamyl-tRNA(Gln) amidotransferase subunit A
MLPDWFETARADAERRGLGHIVPVLEVLRASGERLRRSPWAEHATARVALGGASLMPAAIAPAPDPATVSGPAPAALPGIAATAAQLRSGDVSAAALTEAALDGIARENRRLNAFITVTTDLARADAAAADADLRTGVDRGPLHGIPISVKDLVDVAGYATTAASRVRQFDRATADAPVVTRLRQAGAVIIGKTNLHEFALGPTSEDSAYGPPRHPRDASRLPGGSSGGSAAAVAAGLGFASVGTDTGCSVRIPAALCGIVGLKPRFGEVPVDGVVPLSRRLDHVGPLARSVADARLLYLVMAGRPVSDEALVPDLASLSAGLVTAAITERLEAPVRAAFEAALDRLRAAGLATEAAPLGVLDDAAAAYLPICLADAAAYHAATLETQAADYTPAVRARLEAGRYVTGEDYARATQAQAMMRHAVDRALGRSDVLILPTSPVQAPLFGTTTVRVGDADEPIRNALLRLCQPFNLTRHPAITLPVAAAGDTLPVGLQLVASDTERLLEIALAVEAALTDPVD